MGGAPILTHAKAFSLDEECGYGELAQEEKDPTMVMVMMIIGILPSYLYTHGQEGAAAADGEDPGTRGGKSSPMPACWLAGGQAGRQLAHSVSRKTQSANCGVIRHF